jgi:alpha/beta superfamily hydrolase
MQLPSYLKGDGLKTHAIAIGIGVVATMVIGFTWGGWIRGSTARQMTDKAVNAEIVALYTPECVKRFEAQTNMPEHWAALKKANTDYDQQSFIEKAGFATPPGAKVANDDVADACANDLTTVLKKQPDVQAKTKS